MGNRVLPPNLGRLATLTKFGQDSLKCYQKSKTPTNYILLRFKTKKSYPLPGGFEPTLLLVNGLQEISLIWGRFEGPHKAEITAYFLLWLCYIQLLKFFCCCLHCRKKEQGFQKIDVTFDLKFPGLIFFSIHNHYGLK